MWVVIAGQGKHAWEKGREKGKRATAGITWGPAVVICNGRQYKVLMSKKERATVEHEER